jgi:carbamoyl-phosphate synthase small subunit
MDGILVLEDGFFFRGWRFGAEPSLATEASQPAATADPSRHVAALAAVIERGAGSGEVVFNTSFVGYQEIVTDPSYAGQIVTLTTSHVGNYGVNQGDTESSKVRAAGLLVRDYCDAPSNWRSERSLHEELVAAGVPGLHGLDTRALTIHLRENGAQRGVLRTWTGRDLPLAGHVSAFPELAALHAMVAEAAALPSMAGQDLAQLVTCTTPWTDGPADAKYHVVALDFGIKRNIVRQLVLSGCRVTVVPAKTTAAEVLAYKPDGVLLSNGPGDPEPCTYAVETIRTLLGKVPLFGICLGHQLLAIACGGQTYKLKFGHRGGNHPVRDLDTGKVEITSQNHGFAVNSASLDGREVAVTHINLNDDTVEGMRHKRHAAFSVQFHPEAAPGPHDSHHLFQRFVGLLARKRKS